MTSIVTARQGDTLDAICWRELGTTSGGVVEQALALNPDLIALGTRVTEGAAVILPDPPATSAPTLETINLWD